MHAAAPRPFDFLVAGELVRQPLQQLATALGISAVRRSPLSCFLHPIAWPQAQQSVVPLKLSKSSCSYPQHFDKRIAKRMTKRGQVHLQH
jgi:hypothetical protein